MNLFVDVKDKKFNEVVTPDHYEAMRQIMIQQFLACYSKSKSAFTSYYAEECERAKDILVSVYGYDGAKIIKRAESIYKENE